jgi:NADH dehydrogenase
MPDIAVPRVMEAFVTKVVIVGGGMAGVACASELGHRDVDVTLIDRNDYLQFQPLLYQVATSQLPAEDVARPLHGAFADHPSVTVVRAEVSGIDFATRVVTTAAGPIEPADHLVVAAGARPNFFGVPGAAEHSFPLYSVVDAERLRVHLRDQLRVHCSPDPAPGPLSVVVVGGGPTGVETAGAIAELLAALRDAGRLDDGAAVHLVDHGKALLAPFTEKSHAYAMEKLDQFGVKVTLGVAVTKVGPDAVELSDGTTVPTGTVIWGGGESASAVAATTGAKPGRGGRIDVAEDLTVPGFPGVYAVGDVANVPGPGGHPLPQLGSVAQQSGKWAGRTILAAIDGKPARPFHYHDKGIMAMIGRNAAVAEIGARRHQVEGPIAFAAWLGLHAILLSGAHSRVDAFLNWADDYFHHDRAPDLELEGAPSRIAWADDPTDRPTIAVPATT